MGWINGHDKMHICQHRLLHTHNTSTFYKDILNEDIHFSHGIIKFINCMSNIRFIDALFAKTLSMQ